MLSVTKSSDPAPSKTVAIIHQTSIVLCSARENDSFCSAHRLLSYASAAARSSSLRSSGLM